MSNSLSEKSKKVFLVLENLKSGKINSKELEQKTGLGAAQLKHALNDLTRQGFLKINKDNSFDLQKNPKILAFDFGL